MGLMIPCLLDVRRRPTRLSTVGDRVFPVAAAGHCTSLLPPSLSIFCCRLKSHLFSLSYPAVWLFSHLYSARAVTRHFGQYNRYYFQHFNILVASFKMCAYVSKINYAKIKYTLHIRIELWLCMCLIIRICKYVNVMHSKYCMYICCLFVCRAESFHGTSGERCSSRGRDSSVPLLHRRRADACYYVDKELNTFASVGQVRCDSCDAITLALLSV